VPQSHRVRDVIHPATLRLIRLLARRAALQAAPANRPAAPVIPSRP